MFCVMDYKSVPGLQINVDYYVPGTQIVNAENMKITINTFV